MTEKNTKKGILFVDDDEKVLASLRRTFFDMEDEWDMAFAQSGAEALAYLKEHHCDVVISDMRMPEMDGAELLNKIKDLYPHTVRFILSGYSDKDMILRTVGPTHQFLSKPCDPELVKQIIQKALESQSLIDERYLRSIVSHMRALPTLPDLYVRLKKALHSKDVSFSDIAEILKQDVAITAKILQLVNSAFFGLRSRIENVQMALSYLGIETLKAVILTTDIFSQFTEEEINTFDINGLYKHSVFVSMLARKIVQTTNPDQKFQDMASMAGMMHDVGKLVFIRNKPEEYKKVYQKHREERQPLYVVEKEILGATHADIGGYLLSTWGLPEEIITAVSLHHNPMYSLNASFDSLTAVHIANVLAHEEKRDLSYEIEQELNKGYLTRLELMHCLPEWREITKLVKEMEEKEEERERQEGGKQKEG